jgi:hypothetical protein
MRKAILTTSILCCVFGSSTGYSQQPGSDPNATVPAPPPGATVMPIGPGAAAFSVGGPMFGRDAFSGVVSALGELNLAPDFNLSAEQEQKVQSIRDDFKSAMNQWRSDNADQLKQLDDQQKEMFDAMQSGGGMPDPGQMMEIAEQRRALNETAPNGEAHAGQLKEVLTADQRKRLDDRLAEIEEERKTMLQRMPFRFRGAGAPAADPKDDEDKDKDKDKDADGKKR